MAARNKSEPTRQSSPAAIVAGQAKQMMPKTAPAAAPKSKVSRIGNLGAFAHPPKRKKK